MLKLMKIDTNDVNLHKPYDLIQIGTAAKLHVANYKKSTDFKESTLRGFYKKVSMLLVSLTSHFMEKSPLKHLIVRSRPVSTQLFSLAQTNMKSQRNNLVKLWKNWLPLVVLIQRRQTKVRTSMKKCWRNLSQNTEKSLLILIYLLTDLMIFYTTFVCKEVRYSFQSLYIDILFASPTVCLWNVALVRIRNM